MDSTSAASTRWPTFGSDGAQILSKHEPEPLPGDVAQAVHKIVERAEAQYEKAKG
jgi:hypothetical protein